VSTGIGKRLFNEYGMIRKFLGQGSENRVLGDMVGLGHWAFVCLALDADLAKEPIGGAAAPMGQLDGEETQFIRMQGLGHGRRILKCERAKVKTSGRREGRALSLSIAR
jgi:hypothetical protein